MVNCLFLLSVFFYANVNCFNIMNAYFKKSFQLNSNSNSNNHNQISNIGPNRYYGLSSLRFIELMRKLNNKNNTEDELIIDEKQMQKHIEDQLQERIRTNRAKYLNSFGIRIEIEGVPTPDDIPIGDIPEDRDDSYYGQYGHNSHSKKKSQNFEVVKQSDICFKDIGGYDLVKSELKQCVDILKNYKKYRKFNVRVPKGLILEGPPGTGKTMLAKAFASEANCSFIALAGSDFQEKYVGIGPSRIKELFKLAKENTPCIIFIDEIDAVGRMRSSDGESSSNERDNTLNALLVEMDGFKNNSGIFLIAATNRIDLLDPALTRPGRIDKKISIGLPDTNTREEIINIHIKGKPHDETVKLPDVLEITEGFTGAQIENLLNEAMLHALKLENEYFTNTDLDLIMNKMLAGWQPTDHEYTSDAIDRIAIHEMGHAITGYLLEFHSNVSKVVINLSSPKSPGYTIFKRALSTLHTKENLFERLVVLLSGRIAEEVFYNVSVTTGAINDFEEALYLAEKMILYYGMGTKKIYPSKSEKYKELIDDEIRNLIDDAENLAQLILLRYKNVIYDGAMLLKQNKKLTLDDLDLLINQSTIDTSVVNECLITFTSKYNRNNNYNNNYY